MFKTYQEYGVATITTTDLMRKLDETDADLQELNKSVAEVQRTVMDFFTSQREQDALAKLDVIHALMDGYRTAKASKDPQALPLFLARVSSGDAVQGTLFDRAFIAATNEYTKLLADQAVKARSASVGACTYYGSNFLGIKLNPDSGDYYFQDDTWTGPRVDLTDWMDKSNPIWTWVGPGRVACDNARNDFIAARSTETKAALADRLAAVETVFKSWATVSGGENLVGQYQNGSDAQNAWLTAYVVKTGPTTLRWTNAAQVSWTLTLTDDLTKLAVGSDSPYFANGYTTAKVVFAEDGNVSGIVGPEGELYAFGASR